MKGHPSEAARAAAQQDQEKHRQGVGAALALAVIDVDKLRARADVDSLGTRVKECETKLGVRSYYLEGFAFRGEGGPVRFYRLSGGVGSAVTALDAEGNVVADANRPTRGLSKEFREWIAETVSRDQEHCGF